MKRTLVFVAALFLVSGLAWAVDPAEPLFAEEGGGCTLPDFSGLSEEQRMSAALAAGLQVSPTPAAYPVCPVTFQCSSIGNCGIGPICSLTDIGSCCTSGGFTICCTQGTFKVRRCPCVCTGAICSTVCTNSDDVRRTCS